MPLYLQLAFFLLDVISGPYFPYLLCCLHTVKCVWLSWQRICLQCRRPGFDPGWGRSPGERKGYLLQYSGLKNSMNCIVHGVTKSQTQLSNFHSLDGSRVWGRIDTCIYPWTEEPGRLWLNTHPHTHVSMAESLRCSPETITALFVNRLHLSTK